MSRGDVERKGSMSDLWVIFEIPTEETSDRGGGPFEADIISMLSHSQSDVSLNTLGDSPRTQRKPKLTSSCKRIDITSPLHRNNSCGDSVGTWSSDENDSTVCSNEPTICYFAGDRWSASEAPRGVLYPAERHNNDAIPSVPSPTKCDYSPRFPPRSSKGAMSSCKSDIGPPRTPKRSMECPVASKSDCSPRRPLRRWEMIMETADVHPPRFPLRNEGVCDTLVLPPLSPSPTLPKTDSIPRFPRRMATDSSSSDESPSEHLQTTTGGHHVSTTGMK